MTQVFSFVVNFGCAVAKLFPLRYYCDTHQCSNTVHNAVMTLGSGLIDLLERAASLAVLIPPDDTMCFGMIQIPAWFPLRLQKAAQLFVTLSWTLSDIFTGASNAPGPGTTALIVSACIMQILLLSLDTCSMCLQPERSHGSTK